MGSEVANAIETELLSVDSLTPYAKNPRTGDVEAIKESLIVNGQYRAIVVRAGTHDVLAGNHTLAAAKALGWSELLCHVVDVDDEQAARIVLVDNRSNDLATYDNVALTELLRSLPDLKGSGYGDDFLDELLTELAPAKRKDDTPAVELEGESRTKRGDVYALAGHRLICGDAASVDDVAQLMDGNKATIAVTSPPYASQRTYDESSGFKPIHPDSYGEWFAEIAATTWTALDENGSLFLNIKEHCSDGQRDLYVKRLVIHLVDLGWKFVDEFCWVDTNNGVPGGWTNRFKDAWEPVFQMSKTTSGFTFNPLANGTESSHTFSYSPENATAPTGSGLLGNKKANGFQDGIARPSNVLTMKAENAGLHSAPFPVKLPEWFIRAYSNADDIIFEPFAGSGTTIIAAENERRRCYAVEISPKYCDIIVDRWERHTGQKAELLDA